MTRKRLLLTLAGALTVAAAIALTVVALRPTGPDTGLSPLGLTPEGLFPVSRPRTTDGVDPCTLITHDENRALIGPDAVSYPSDVRRCTFSGTSQGARRLVDVYVGGHSLIPRSPEDAPHSTIAGYPTWIGPAEGLKSTCRAYVILEPEPGGDRLFLESKSIGAPNCDLVHAAAELAIPRLPRRNPDPT